VVFLVWWDYRAGFQQNRRTPHRRGFVQESWPNADRRRGIDREIFLCGGAKAKILPINAPVWGRVLLGHNWTIRFFESDVAFNSTYPEWREDTTRDPTTLGITRLARVDQRAMGEVTLACARGGDEKTCACAGSEYQATACERPCRVESAS